MKRKNQRKISVFAAVMLAASVFTVPQSISSAASSNYNYGEALQKSIMFYEFQRSGDLPDNQRNNWRGDSGMTDGADNNVDLTGGWYDAGDMVKFNLPMAYTSTMLAWSVYESKDAYKKSGQLPYILDNIKWATDYLIKCHPSPNLYYYQVGDSADDHKWWGPAEVMQEIMERPSFAVTPSNPGSTIVAEAAAALASASIIFKESDPTYSALCLKHAKELFTFADTTRSDDGYTEAEGCYHSWSGFFDELTWASTWIYLATNDKTYLEKAESYEPSWERERGTNTIKFKWAHCWDQKLFGSLLLLSRITDKPLYKEAFERHMDWWVGIGSESITYTPKGLAWLDKWGSIRYATTEAFLAQIYALWSGCSSSKVSEYKSFAKSQTDYALGSTGRSFQIGFGVNPPKRPHHRTAHGSWMGYVDCDIPNYHRHVLVGALVGGPDASDAYTDDIKNYENNEVACDYNAGFTGVLAMLYDQYGGNPIENLNAIETPVDDEYELMCNVSGTTDVQIRVGVGNKTGWPARIGDKYSCKYFVDLTEAIKANVKPESIQIVQMTGSNGKVSGFLPWDEENNIYYINVDFTGYKIYPGDVNKYKIDSNFIVKIPYGSFTWDHKNDFSYQGLGASSSWEGTSTKKVPIYSDGVLVYGSEPGGGSNTPVPSNTPSYSPTNNTSGVKVSGYIKPDLNSDSTEILSGFKVSIDGKEAITDDEGYFEVKNVKKTGTTGCSLTISKKGYLARTLSDLTITKDTKISDIADPVLLWAGDSNQDGSVNMSDIIVIAKAFNSTSQSANYNEATDYNLDGSVNMSDVLIAARSFNKTTANYPEI